MRRAAITGGIAALITIGLLSASVAASPGRLPEGARVLPQVVSEIDIDEHLGQALDLDLPFIDDRGRSVHLRDYFLDGKPVLLVLAWFNCPLLCDLLLRTQANAVSQLGKSLAPDFHVLTISFDPDDTAAAAALKRTTYLQSINISNISNDRSATQPTNLVNWPFLVAKGPAIRALTDRLGFRYAYDPKTRQYAHPACAFVLTPNGTISRYLYGVDFPPRDLKLALLEAGQGHIGGIVDRVLLSCYRYDPSTRRYALMIAGVTRGGSALLLLCLTLWLVKLFRAGKDHAQKHGEAPPWMR